MSPSVYINIAHESEKYQELQSNFRCAFPQTDMELYTHANVNDYITKKNNYSVIYNLLFLSPREIFLHSKNASI